MNECQTSSKLYLEKILGIFRSRKNFFTTQNPKIFKATTPTPALTKKCRLRLPSPA